MLVSLTIQNVVLIEYLNIGFQNGLCVLTGETGAGKSILLDSLSLAIGARAESRLVRKGAEQASVTAMFDVSLSDDLVQEHDIIIEPGEPIILKRVLTSDGRSRAYINDQPVSAGLLRQVGEALVEIHGQFDTRGLLNPSTHRAMLDEYAGVNDELSQLWGTWKMAEKDLKMLQQKAQQTRADEVYLRESLEDLDLLSPQAGEEETLSELRDRLRHREQALKALSAAHFELGGDKDPVSKALKLLDPILEKLPETAEEAIAALDRARHEIEEAQVLIASVRDDLYYEDQKLEDVDDRLNELRVQARKHNCHIDDLPQKRDEIAAQLNEIEHQDELLAQKTKAVQVSRTQYCVLADKISKTRKQKAQTLDQAVMAELPPLKLDKARFVTVVEDLPEFEWGPHGINHVQFLVATNPGSDPGPLHKIASGGEMARFMLALKVVMAHVGQACTMVFDEVDAGVGGAVADAVGERLARLSDPKNGGGKQVMVVTHAPQIAAKADVHYIVRKDGIHKDGADIVNTNVVRLSEAAERREEIARMLAGASITAEARAAAERLMGG